MIGRTTVFEPTAISESEAQKLKRISRAGTNLMMGSVFVVE
jgi:hypothetical protein